MKVLDSQLMRNKQVLAALSQDAEPQRHPETIYQEIEALRSHQRAHDDLLRDLTYQLSQTNVTVFREKVAENFVNLKDGFLQLQREREAQSDEYERYKHDQKQQFRDFQRDFVELLKHVTSLEDHMKQLREFTLKKQQKQDQQLFTLREVVKRSGIYNHYLTYQHASAQPQQQATAPSNEALLQMRTLQECELDTKANLQLINELEEKCNERLAQQDRAIGEKMKTVQENVQFGMQAALKEQDSKMQAYQQKYIQLAKESAEMAGKLENATSDMNEQQKYFLNFEKQELIQIQAENGKMASTFTQFEQQLEENQFELKQFETDFEENQKFANIAKTELAELRLEFDNFIQQSKIESYYVRVDDICDNEDKILLKLEEEENEFSNVEDREKQLCSELDESQEKFKEQQFETEEILIKQVSEYEEMKLKLATFMEEVNIQAINELIEEKVEVDTLQFSTELLQVNQELQRFEERQCSLEEMLKEELDIKQKTDIVVNHPLSTGTSLEELSDYNGLQLDDLPDIPVAVNRKVAKKYKEEEMEYQILKEQREKMEQLTTRLSLIEKQLHEDDEDLAKKIEKQSSKIDVMLKKQSEYQSQLKTMSTVEQVNTEHIQNNDKQLEEFSEVFKNEMLQVVNTYEKFEIVEQSQKDVINALKVLKDNYDLMEERLKSKQSIELEDEKSKINELEGAFLVHEQLTEELSDKIKAMRQPRANENQRTGEFAEKEPNSTIIGKLEDELSHLHENVTFLLSKAEKMRMEQTAINGKVQNIDELLNVSNSQLLKHKGWIYKLQDVCVEEESEIVGLKEMLKQWDRDIKEVQESRDEEAKMNITKQVAQNIAVEGNFELDQLRKMLKDTETEFYNNK